MKTAYEIPFAPEDIKRLGQKVTVRTDKRYSLDLTYQDGRALADAGCDIDAKTRNEISEILRRRLQRYQQ